MKPNDAPRWLDYVDLDELTPAHRGTSVLRYPGPVSWASKGRLHPHQKPVELLVELLSKTPPGDVADPFAGSGSTVIACQAVQRRCDAVEVSEHFCDVICARWQAMTGRRPVLESTGAAHDFGGTA